MSSPLLEVRELHTEFTSDDGVVRAVDGVTFSLERGEVLGIVGESGCGKSATSLSVMRLLPLRQGRISGGSVLLDGVDLTALREGEMRRIRGRRIAMIFQDPMTSLNPYLKIEAQLVEGPMLHLGLSRRQARERSIELLGRVGIADPADRMSSYPHELSGGMRQRVMIAMALLCDPELIIADEPTTALDVTIQAQILDLLLELSRERNVAIILITHDLGVVASTCHRVIVMYAGRIVEAAPSSRLFKQPSHPYTAALLRSVPRVDRREAGLESIGGLPPRLDGPRFDACTFAPRCRQVHDACLRGEPPLLTVAPQHFRRCVLAPENVR